MTIFVHQKLRYLKRIFQAIYKLLRKGQGRIPRKILVEKRGWEFTSHPASFFKVSWLYCKKVIHPSLFQLSSKCLRLYFSTCCSERLLYFLPPRKQKVPLTILILEQWWAFLLFSQNENELFVEKKQLFVKTVGKNRLNY